MTTTTKTTSTLETLSPKLKTLAQFLAEACASDETRPSLGDLCAMTGWTKNAASWRISHLRRMGLRTASGGEVVLARE